MAATLAAGEREALEISANIQARHVPYGTVLDPVLAPSGAITSYSRCGDSAIWTGHYLAAEAFRYRVTRSPDAFANVARALGGIRILRDVTGTGLLARCAFPVDSPYAADLIGEESGHGVRTGTIGGQTWYWIGNTSRDQYSGVFFGLAVAWDMVDDAQLRAVIRDLTVGLLDFLLRHDWTVAMPDGGASTTFAIRPDQQLTLLQIGRHIDDRFDRAYRSLRFWSGLTVALPVTFEVLDPHHSYFKFNLDAINLYNLIRLEGEGFYQNRYRDAYNVLRYATNNHGNAHFNVIDFALRGPDEARDRETAELLNAWLRRPRLDGFVDLRGVVRECGDDRACDPLPVEARVRTDFLWQRSPFLLYGGGEGKIEGAGIDYILPYWMARYYGAPTGE